MCFDNFERVVTCFGKVMTSFHPRRGVKDFEQNTIQQKSQRKLLTKQLEFMLYVTLPTAEILSGKNARTFVVCGF